MLGTLAFLGTNWQWVIVVGLAVASLAAVAWLFKNWKPVLVAVGLLVVYFGGQALWVDGYNTHVAEEVARQTAALQARLDATNAAAQADAMRAQRASGRIAELERKAADTPANDNECLDEGAARRVGGIR